jgi:putative heme-binding domain-containing protein
LFINAMESEVRQEAVFRLAQRVKTWSPELVKLAGEVIKAVANADDAKPAEKCVSLVKAVAAQVDNPLLRDAAILALPAHPFERRSDAIVGLESFQASVVEKTLDMMKGTEFSVLPSSSEEQASEDLHNELGGYCVMHLVAARRFQGQPSRERLVRRLLVGATADLLDTPLVKGKKLDTLEEVEAFAKEVFPEQAKVLGTSPILNLAEEQARWAKLDVSKGDSTKGKVIFEQRQCARCHSGNARLGPDLKGVTTRWSVADLFLHTSDPSRQISPTWEGETFTLKDGRKFTGRAVYDSPSAVLVQTTPDETVRITGEELQSRRKAEVSLMPPGLLMGLIDAELADLHAYLRSLQ